MVERCLQSEDGMDIQLTIELTMVITRQKNLGINTIEWMHMIYDFIQSMNFQIVRAALGFIN